MTKLYFVRHGETDLNLQGRCQGRLDYPLNETGRRQLEETAEKFDGIEIDKIYSSPLLRARQSAEIIAERKGLNVHPLEYIVEIDHGELEGMSLDDARKKYAGMLKDWIDRPDTVKFPGGESLDDVRKRMLKGVKEVIMADRGKAVLLLTHQVLGGVARCHFEGLPLSAMWRDKLAPGEFFRIDIDEEKEKIEVEKAMVQQGAGAPEEKIQESASLTKSLQ